MKITKTLLPIALLVAGLACGYSKPNTAVPTIASLDPASANAGTGPLQLEVNGAKFAAGAVINFNGVAQTTQVVSTNKVEATIPASAVSASGSVPVTVTNPSGTGIYANMGAVTSNPMNFTIN
ncbi:MAG: IPT/TIG domain-containing protein [Candidatus Sulfotelmatobacter sp.]